MVWQAGNGQTSPGDCSDHKLERWLRGRDTHICTHTLAENEKVIISTALSDKRKIFSNKFLMIFFLYSLLTWSGDMASCQDQQVE